MRILICILVLAGFTVTAFPTGEDAPQAFQVFIAEPQSDVEKRNADGSPVTSFEASVFAPGEAAGNTGAPASAYVQLQTQSLSAEPAPGVVAPASVANVVAPAQSAPTPLKTSLKKKSTKTKKRHSKNVKKRGSKSQKGIKKKATSLKKRTSGKLKEIQNKRSAGAFKRAFVNPDADYKKALAIHRKKREEADKVEAST